MTLLKMPMTLGSCRWCLVTNLAMKMRFLDVTIFVDIFAAIEVFFQTEVYVITLKRKADVKLQRNSQKF